MSGADCAGIGKQILFETGEDHILGRDCDVTHQTEVSVIFDTGSTHLWVPSAARGQPGCLAHARFDARAKRYLYVVSTTRFRSPFRRTHGSFCRRREPPRRPPSPCLSNVVMQVG